MERRGVELEENLAITSKNYLSLSVIHCNAGGSTGTETFYSSEQGRLLANAIQNQIVNSVGTFNRGVKFGGHFVLHYTDMPAVLVECAFIDNPHDAKFLRERDDDFARAIARGISDFVAK